MVQVIFTAQEQTMAHRGGQVLILMKMRSFSTISNSKVLKRLSGDFLNSIGDTGMKAALMGGSCHVVPICPKIMCSSSAFRPCPL
jgi:hypothetical protein